MNIIDDILNKAAQIIRTELPNHLSPDFIISVRTGQEPAGT